MRVIESDNVKNKKVELSFTDYRIEGEVKVIDWYDHEGMLYMDSYNVDSLDLEELKTGINDGGFGVKKIVSATIDIYENYEGWHVFKESMEIEL
jgi:hypothetical protein